ncbi:homocysteine-responsive endoplasmic reticulum-resident ubiquitin-like domain member 2 protein [Argonauta hians]
MEDTTNTPITLIVKAPNQRIADVTVDCMLEWTVKKLKSHISDVYPNKPTIQHQKLIYSGKLLLDNLRLKDIFHQYDQGSQHTIHLVCTQVTDASNKTNTQSTEAKESVPEASAPEPASFTAPDTELRHRSHNAEGFYNPSMTNSPFPQQIPYVMSPMGPLSQPGFLYSPEQYAWMQQMYSQYMAQYMQYYQPGTIPAPVTTNMPPNNAMNNQPEVNNAEVRQGNPNLRMNAQGVLDDEDEFEQRDWLDWMYKACRFAILMGIFYYYSTLSRFVIVFLTCFMLYIHQAGWFQVQRQPIPMGAPPRDQNGPVAQPAPAVNEHQNENPDAQQNEGTSDESGSDESQSEPREPALPRGLSLVWLLVRTFFTSLFPQQPPAVNAN